MYVNHYSHGLTHLLKEKGFYLNKASDFQKVSAYDTSAGNKPGENNAWAIYSRSKIEEHFVGALIIFLEA